jgi:catalase
MDNIAGSLGQAPRKIQERQLRHFAAADPHYGAGVATRLGTAALREEAAA